MRPDEDEKKKRDRQLKSLKSRALNSALKKPTESFSQAALMPINPQ
jgi:hypothetical protein